MPVVTLNINFTQTLEGKYEIDVDIPQDVLDGDGDLIDWVEEHVENLESKALANGDIESEEFEITEIEDLGEPE